MSMHYLGHIYTKNIFIVYLKCKFLPGVLYFYLLIWPP